jgi:hypothetical protein
MRALGDKIEAKKTPLLNPGKRLYFFTPSLISHE